MVIKLSVTLSICSMNTNIYRHILLRERYKKKDLGNIDKWINRWSEFGWIPLNAPYIPYDTERKTVDWKALWGSTHAHAVVLWQDSAVTQQSVCCSEISSPTSLRSRFRPRRTTPINCAAETGGDKTHFWHRDVFTCCTGGQRCSIYSGSRSPNNVP